MRNIHLVDLEKYKDPAKYEQAEEGICRLLADYDDGITEKGDYVSTFSFTVEEEFDGEDKPYPLEDMISILINYDAYVSEFVQYEPGNPVMILEVCTDDSPDEIKRMKEELLGKRIYKRVDTEDGLEYTELIIENE